MPIIRTPCACTRVRRAARAITDLYDDALRGTGLKVTQFAVLRTIGRMEGVSISELADEMALDRSTLGRNLLLLQRRGLVVLAEGADLRQRTAALSARARKVIDGAAPAWERAQAKVGGALGAKGMEDLFRLLGQLEEIRGPSK